MNLKRKALSLVAATAVLLIASIGVAWYAYGQIGKTPGELMDYAERRLQGHNKLELWADRVLDAPTLAAVFAAH